MVQSQRDFIYVTSDEVQYFVQKNPGLHLNQIWVRWRTILQNDHSTIELTSPWELSPYLAPIILKTNFGNYDKLDISKLF